MSEYEYEVTFYGSQWKASVIVYHEVDSEKGSVERGTITLWAEGVADQLGLTLADYHEVKVEKLGELANA
jgi:hypothetical protein